MSEAENTVDRAYMAAACATGKSVEELRSMAVIVMASMLHHAMENPATPIWTVTRIEAGQLELEVNIPPRRRHEGTEARRHEGETEAEVESVENVKLVELYRRRLEFLLRLKRMSHRPSLPDSILLDRIEAVESRLSALCLRPLESTHD